MSEPVRDNRVCGGQTGPWRSRYRLHKCSHWAPSLVLKSDIFIHKELWGYQQNGDLFGALHVTFLWTRTLISDITFFWIRFAFQLVSDSWMIQDLDPDLGWGRTRAPLICGPMGSGCRVRSDSRFLQTTFDKRVFNLQRQRWAQRPGKPQQHYVSKGGWWGLLLMDGWGLGPGVAVQGPSQIRT